MHDLLVLQYIYTSIATFKQVQDLSTSSNWQLTNDAQPFIF